MRLANLLLLYHRGSLFSTHKYNFLATGIAGGYFLQYNRYADDFVVGVIGSKHDALSIKEDLRQFLAEKLHLTLSEEKTKVTHSSEAVRYLGYDIRVVREKSAKRDKNGALKRP